MSEEYIKVFKPKQNLPKSDTPKATSKRKSIAKTPKRQKNPELISDKGSEDVLEKVFALFEQKIVHTKQEIHKDLFDSTYENIIEYFNFYTQKRETCTGRETADEQLIFNPVCNVIPTITLFTGINIQDYSYLCDNLSQRLRERFTRQVFYINEKNSQNIKALINSIFSQWEANLEEEEQTIKRSLFTIRHLFESIKKEQNKSVIFIFKQFELISKETIENFVSLISCYLESASIYFIIELASQSNVIYERLNSNVISKLCIKKLYFMSPEQYMERFLTQLFVEQTTLFKLSGEILKYLSDLYYENNFSVSSFVHALKFCFYEHIQSNKLNALMLTSDLGDEANLFEAILYNSILNDEQAKSELEHICQSRNEKNANVCVQKLQQEWLMYNNQYVFICRILHEILKRFPSEQNEDSLFSAKTFIDLYIKVNSLSSHESTGRAFTETDQFCNLKNLLKLSSSGTMDEIVLSVNCFLYKIFDSKTNFSDEFLNDVQELAEIMNKMIASSKQDDEENDVVNDLESIGEKEVEVKKRATVSRRSSVRTLKTISENSSPTKKRASLAPTKAMPKKNHSLNMNALKNLMIEWVVKQCSKYFDTDFENQTPFGQYFCYKNIDRLKKNLFDVQRLNMHDCLLNSFKYLRLNEILADSSPKKRSKRKSLLVGNSLNEDDQHLLPLNVAYKLYLECGHMINLCDWLNAFVDRIENADLKELNPTKRKLLQALFFRSITELQFMGLIKPTNRKVDHVVKLTNGSSLLAVE